MKVEVWDAEFGGSALTVAALNGSAPPEWFPGLIRPGLREADRWKACVDAARSAGSDRLRRLGPALSPTSGSNAAHRLARAMSNGVAVTTGQQPGLFGGPLYTLSKAVTALALADEVERATGVAVVPIFWAATDDADALEASTIVVPGMPAPSLLAMDISASVGRSIPLSNLPLPGMAHEIATFRRAGGSGAGATISESVARAYSARTTVGGAYVTLLRELLEPLGICVLDAAHEAVREAAYPLLNNALERSSDLEIALRLRNDTIRAAGYKPQVKEVRGKSLVFEFSADSKRRLAVGDPAPEGGGANLSATVILRPVVERAIMPTVAYVAGPAELAYFAQVSAVADSLGVAQPSVAPRWSGVVVDNRLSGILSRYGLAVNDFSDPHRMETLAAREGIPSDVADAIAELERAVGDGVSRLAALEDIPLPPAVVDGLASNFHRRIERLERRAGAAIKRKGSEKLRDLASARESLFPMGKPQERAVSWTALLSRYGDDMLNGMIERARLHARTLV